MLGTISSTVAEGLIMLYAHLERARSPHSIFISASSGDVASDECHRLCRGEQRVDSNPWQGSSIPEVLHGFKMQF